MSDFDLLDKDILDVVIIGCGPAGLTAGIYTSRARLKTLVIESYSVTSQALLTSEIENYPGFPDGIGGYDLLEKFKKQAVNFGSEIIAGDVVKIEPYRDNNINLFKIVIDNKSYNTLSVIVASGAKPRELQIPGEKKYRGRGVSYCAICDGAFFKDKNIIVVGGGNTAIEEALFLTKFGEKVTVIHRRDRLRATKLLQERILSNEKVCIIWDSVVSEIIGKDSVKGVKILNIKTNNVDQIDADGVFIFIGYQPNTNFADNLLALDKGGSIIVNDRMQSSMEGIFACGDCRDTYLKQIVTACGDGAFAAISAKDYIEKLKGTSYE